VNRSGCGDKDVAQVAAKVKLEMPKLFNHRLAKL
jgi:hypothetical protein